MLFGAGYRDRIETGIINILYGASPYDQPGQSIFDLSRYQMALTHFLMLGLPILTILLVVVSIFRLRKLSDRLKNSRFSFWGNLTFFALVNVLLPLYLLFIVPKKSVSWDYMRHYIPDVAWFTLILSVLLLGIGLCKGALIAGLIKDRRYPKY
jgi:hypothetical protein